MSTGLTTQIEIDPRGVAWVAGANTKVKEIVLDKLAYGWSPEEMHFQHPHLSMAQIHAALATRGGEVSGTNTLTSCKPCKQGAVFIIRMRAGMENAGDHVKAFQGLRQPHCSAIFGDLGCRCAHRKYSESCSDQKEQQFCSGRFHIENLMNKFWKLY